MKLCKQNMKLGKQNMKFDIQNMKLGKQNMKILVVLTETYCNKETYPVAAQLPCFHKV